MSETPQVTDEELNAYVDGELDAAAAARVARAVADDLDLAHRVAMLSRLRSALAESVEAPLLSVPPPTRQRRLRPAIAAAVALLLLLAGGLGLAGWHERAERAWLQQAWTLHDEWSPATPPMPAQVAAPAPFVPDLSAGKLRVALVRGGEQALVGYVGTRGCKLSLLNFAAPPGLSESLLPFHDGARLAYAWRVGGSGYALLAEGIDPARFQLIAEAVRDALVKRLQPDPRTRTALRRSREDSVPCRA